MAVLTKEQWRRRRARQRKMKKLGILAGFALIVILVLLLIVKVISGIFNSHGDGMLKNAGDYKVKDALLSVSDYSRSGIAMEKVNNIVLHYTGVPGMTAKEKRDYYESLKDKKDNAESVHFIVDLDGTIYQLIPTTEIACASMAYNEYGISIEYCHTSSDGAMSAKTYQALVALIAQLCDEYDLTSKSVIRHYDITHKECPKYLIDDTVWKQFKEDIDSVMKGKTIKVTDAPAVTNPATAKPENQQEENEGKSA